MSDLGFPRRAGHILFVAVFPYAPYGSSFGRGVSRRNLRALGLVDIRDASPRFWRGSFGQVLRALFICAVFQTPFGTKSVDIVLFYQLPYI
jgi:hypothetical protein